MNQAPLKRHSNIAKILSKWSAIICFCSAFFFSGPLQAQKTWTLQECVDIAISNNITIRQRENTMAGAAADLRQSKISMLPSLNGQATHNYNQGFAIDPATNQARQDVTFRNNSFALNANMTLFNGLQQQNTVRLQRANTKASEQDVEAIRNNTRLSVANAYLQTLMNMEIVERNRLQVEATRQQHLRQHKLVELGGANRVKLLQLKAQLANEELLIITSQNQLDQSYLTLWQLMNLDPDTSARIARPDFDIAQISNEPRDAKQIYAEFLNKSPEARAAKLRTESSSISRYVALGSKSPRITMNAGLNSFYSTQTLRGAGAVTTQPITIGFDVNGNPIQTLRSSYSSTEVTPFSEQFDRNLGKSLGFTLFVPIFNGWQVNTSLQKAKINEQSSRLAEKQVENELFKSISQAHQDFRSAQKRYEASENSFQANKESFTLAEGQFNAGAISTTDYLNIKNEFLKAQGSYLQSRYELVFRRKVLDFYLGKPLY